MKAVFKDLEAAENFNEKVSSECFVSDTRYDSRDNEYYIVLCSGNVNRFSKLTDSFNGDLII